MQHDTHKETNRINMNCVMLKTSFKPYPFWDCSKQSSESRYKQSLWALMQASYCHTCWWIPSARNSLGYSQNHCITRFLTPSCLPLMSFGALASRGQYPCTTILWNLLRSPFCHHNHASWHAQAGYHVAQHPSWSGPPRSTRCIILLTAQALHNVISLHLPSWASDSGQRCSGVIV